MSISDAVNQELSELDKLKSVRVYFCYSSEMDEDIDRLQILIREKSRSSFSALDIDYRNWRNERVFQLEPRYIEFQDYLNDSILLSDYVVFLMWHKPGPHTLEEFQLCCEKIKPLVILGVRDNDNGYESLRHELDVLQRVRAYKYLDVETVAFRMCEELTKRNREYIQKLTDLSLELAYSKGVIDTLWQEVDKRRSAAGLVPLSEFKKQVARTNFHLLKTKPTTKQAMTIDDLSSKFL